MSPENEKKLLASLYDRLFDAITYQPAGKTPALDKRTTFMQMAKNVVINPADFAGMMNPANPAGDLKMAEMFATFVDQQPSLEPLWADSGKKVSATFNEIVNGANTDSTIDPKQQALYNKAKNYLSGPSSITDMNGDLVGGTVDTPIMIAFDENQQAYEAAVSAYRTAYNGYDLTEKKDQRAWNAIEGTLSGNIERAWNKWTRDGKAQVVQAKNAMASSINDAVSNAIADAQAAVAPGNKFASLTGVAADKWLPSYALPTNWTSNSLAGSKLEFKSAYLNKTESSEATSYSVAASGSWGLWHASAGVSGGNKETHAHMEAENLTLSAELILVQIKRPWLNPLLLSMTEWWVKGVSKGGIANGTVPGPKNRLMPVLPTAFVIAKNVKITADFSSADKSFISNTISTSASGGWGPFSVSGSYSHSSSNSKFQSKFDGSTLELPGMQVVAWINSIMPSSPPMDPKKPA